MAAVVIGRDSVPVLALLGASVLGVVLIGAFTPEAAFTSLHSDVALYHEVGERMAGGQLPYRDFPSEYPPLAMVPIALARFVPSAASVDVGTFAIRLLAVNAALLAAGFAIVGWLGSNGHHADRTRGWGGAAAATAPYAAISIILGALVAWRFDILPAVLSAAAFALLVARRPGLSGIALAAAVAAKLYAAPLALLFIAWYLVRGERAEAMRFGAGVLAVGVVVLVPLALVGAFDLSFVRYQLDRGLQIESVPAGIAGVAHLLGVDAVVRPGFGADQLESVLTEPLLALFSVLAPVVIAVVIGVGVVRLRQQQASGGADVRTLAALVAATLLAVITTNKVLSPQYLIWLLPFVSLLSSGPRVLMIAAAALTAVEFPLLYGGLQGLGVGPVLVVNLRNALLVATLAWLIVEAWPLRRTVRSNRPQQTGVGVGAHATAEGGN